MHTRPDLDHARSAVFAAGRPGSDSACSWVRLRDPSRTNTCPMTITARILPKSRMLETMSMVLVLDQLDQLAVELVAATNAAIVDVGAGDLSFSQWRMLMVLGSSGGSLRIHEIAERVSASMSSASRLVGRMERRGLV